MLAIIILEDNTAEREIIQQMIENRIQINETPAAYDARVVLSTGDPHSVLAYIAEHQDLNYLAFLDIDLKTSLDGIEVASRIKNIGILSQIVFVTADATALRLTIERHVEPLDYITKDAAPLEIQHRIYETVDTAYKRYQLTMTSAKQTSYFTYSKIRNFVEKIPLADLYYISIQPKKYKTLRVYAKNKVFDCLGTLKDYEKRYPSLVPADRQSLINLDAVQNYDEKKGIAYFDQGIAHSVAVRRRRSVMLKLNATKNDLA
ncbi:LytR/AlgR family response regulator transcription factor [Lactobacillus delbrueckii subsp. bulgaricus]|uniref:autolysis-associated response regulator transcription factor n=1 Tax=Lactobacillus delbrueckii TaxID=1584 RepID=UPI0037C7A0A0